jgi:hypothetical protein
MSANYWARKLESTKEPLRSEISVVDFTYKVTDAYFQSEGVGLTKALEELCVYQ